MTLKASDTKNTEHIPFDCVNGNFDISSARSHFELILSQRNHAETMKNREMQMRSRDKSVEQETEVDLGSASEFDEEDTGIESVTLKNERRLFEKEKLLEFVQCTTTGATKVGVE